MRESIYKIKNWGSCLFPLRRGLWFGASNIVVSIIILPIEFFFFFKLALNIESKEQFFPILMKLWIKPKRLWQSSGLKSFRVTLLKVLKFYLSIWKGVNWILSHHQIGDLNVNDMVKFNSLILKWMIRF